MEDDIGKNVIDIGKEERLPAVNNSSQGAEVVKQIIERILANERRRARFEFIQLSVFFLVCLVLITGSGIWFARQLLGQLREERFFAEQAWRPVAGRVEGVRNLSVGADQKKESAFNRNEVAKLEKNIKTISDLLKTNPRDSSTAIREMLKSQKDAIQILSTRLNDAQDRIAGAESGKDVVSRENRRIDFITAPVAEDLKLRMPIPSL